MLEAERLPRVLVVDDDPGMVSTLADILTASGYEVTTATTGNEAVDTAIRMHPDCILMDIRMPGLSGIEAFREIKRSSPESLVIFMTAYSSSTMVDEARAEGAVEVLAKPLDLERTLALLRDTARPTSVLVVDDDKAFCRSLGDALQAHAFDVSLAGDIPMALESLRERPHQVVILDMKLDGGTGLELMPQIKRANPGAVIILVTAFRDLVEEMQSGLSLSAAACFMKPLDVAELVETIREQVSRRRNERDSRA